MLLFVYGSLRRGQLHHSELRGARYAGEARTEPCYALVSLGAYPALVEGGTDAVMGELYEVGEALLAALDAFEEAPEVYQRKPVRLALPQAAQAQAYLMPAGASQDAARIASGDWARR